MNARIVDAKSMEMLVLLPTFEVEDDMFLVNTTRS